MLPPCENSHPLVLAAVDLLQLEVLASDVVQRALVKPEPDHALLNLQADHAVIIEGWDDGRVLLGPLRPGDGLAAPEDVLSPRNLFRFHPRRDRLILRDSAILNLAGEPAQAAQSPRREALEGGREQPGLSSEDRQHQGQEGGDEQLRGPGARWS